MTHSIRPWLALLEAPLSETRYRAFHGTDADFTAFDPHYLGSAHGAAPSNMAGFHFTDDPEVARSFGGRVRAVTIQLDHPVVLDAKGRDYSVFKHILNRRLERINRTKHDGVIIHNYVDAGKHGDPKASTHYVVFDPARVRLVEAVGAAAWQSALDGADRHGTAREAQARRMLRNPAFRRWFGASVVTDRAGLPLMLFHGTTTEIAAFGAAASGVNGSELGPGIYLTNDPAYAGDFADGDGGHLLPVFVAATRIVAKKAAFRAMLRDPAWARVGEIARAQDYEGLGSQLGRFARARGYQAIVSANGPGMLQLCVFDPARVKAAYGNAGSFNPASTDLLEGAAATPARNTRERTPH